MTIKEEMDANPLYDGFRAVFQQMLAEARAKREAGLILPARRLGEGANDWQNYRLGLDWSK